MRHPRIGGRRVEQNLVGLVDLNGVGKSKPCPSPTLVAFLYQEVLA